MQVIWAIGASMVVLAGAAVLGPAGLSRSRRRASWSAHNLLDPIWPASQLLDQQWPLWVGAALVDVHRRRARSCSSFRVSAAAVARRDAAGLRRVGAVRARAGAPERASCWLRALASPAAFVVLRALGRLRRSESLAAAARRRLATVIDFLNTTKYPPSLLFLLMTLGPAAMLCAFADRIRPGSSRTRSITFGRVPFAFYVAHFYLMHAASVLLGVLQGFEPRQFMTCSCFYPQGYGVGAAGRLSACGPWSSRCCIRSAAGWPASRRGAGTGG